MEIQALRDTATEEDKLFAAANMVLALDPDVDVLKMQKLLYYIQGWSLALLGTPVYKKAPQAYVYGPTFPDVRRDMTHSRNSSIEKADVSVLEDSVVEVIYAVVEKFRGVCGGALIDRTHEEKPWLEAREGLGPNERSQVSLSLNTMREFFMAVPSDDALKVRPRIDENRKYPGEEFMAQERKRWAELLKRLSA